MIREALFGTIMGVATAVSLVVLFNPHIVVCFFLGMFATGFWENVYSWFVENPEQR